MNNTEAKNLFSKITMLWPDWKFTEAEAKLNIKQFEYYDYEKAMRLIDKVYFEKKSNYSTPPISSIISLFKCEAVIKRKKDDYIKEPGKLYGEEAFDKSIADILNYPVGHKTRVWLEYYLDETRFKNQPVNSFTVELKPVPTLNLNNERNKQKDLLNIK